MIGVDALLGLGIDADRLFAAHEAHDVEIVWGQIDHDAHVADATGEGAYAATDDLEDAAQLAVIEMLLEGLDSRIEAHDVTDHQLAVDTRSKVDQGLGFVDSRSDGLLYQHVDPR